MKRTFILFSLLLFPFSILLRAQNRPLLPQEMAMMGRDTIGPNGRFLPPHERLRLREQRLMHENPELMGPEEPGLPERMRRDYLRDPAHGSTLPPSTSPSPFPSRLHQNLQPTASMTDTVLEAWVTHYGYNGPGSADDEASALAVDAEGNVYVTGSSWSGTSYDYATIKYDASGVEQWVSRYNGLGNDDDYATALAVDADGNVYVTGYSIGSGTSEDYATIKYNASGVQQWVARYNELGYDIARALAVDADGNVYVTGASGNYPSFDYATIKYNASGVVQWVALYNGPGNDAATALAVDADGNVYVTGSSDLDYATIKYNASGVERWVSRYNGPGNAYDNAKALAVGADGSVYVTGYSTGSGTGYDYASIKYDASGVEQWIARYNGPGNDDDYAYALAVDADGNVYVTGYSTGSGTGYDYATFKYNASGVEQWIARYNGPGNLSDYAYALAVDANGNVYVTGYSYGSGTFYDYATIKYNASGVEQWVSRYNGPGNGYDYAYALAVDADGNVYVTGYSSSSSSGFNRDYATIKYNASGVEQWAARYNGPGNDDDYAYALAVDASGNVYVTGSSWSGTSYDYATIKYNASGVEQCDQPPVVVPMLS